MALPLYEKWSTVDLVIEPFIYDIDKLVCVVFDFIKVHKRKRKKENSSFLFENISINYQLIK